MSTAVDSLRRYGIAIGVTLATAVVRLVLEPVLAEDARLLPFVIPIIIASRLGGIGPGLAATGLSAVLGALFFIGAPGSPLLTPREAMHLSLFLAIGVTVTFLNRELQRARDRVLAEQQRVADRERELRESRDEVRALTDSMPQIVFSANRDGQIDFLNARWYEYTGRPGAGDLDEAVREHTHPEDLPRVIDAWRRSVASGEPYDLQHRVRGRDGAYRWFMVRALPVVGADGRVTRWFGTCTDVDEERRTADEREALLDSERAARGDAERAIRQKDEFVATLSHELRTPLNAILGWMHLLRENPDPATLAKGLEVIERNARAQSQLISDLLDISRITAGKIRLELRALDPAVVVAAAVETLQPAARAREVRLRTRLEAGGARVLGDSDRLQQIVWNLLSNAVKFTPRGGPVEVTLQRAGRSIELRVTDSGQGIPPEALPYIFERYRQADMGRTRRHAGLGLGLSIARHLSELHGGTIEAVPGPPGAGATFLLRLPIYEAPAAETEVDRPLTVQARLDGLRVLVVDDEPDSRELAARVLHEQGVEVEVASSAAEALDVLARRPVDVLVSDIGMPDVDGYQLLRDVRRLPGGERLPAVALTAFARREDRTRSLVEGYQLHLSKPVEPAELLRAVMRLAAGGPVASL